MDASALVDSGSGLREYSDGDETLEVQEPLPSLHHVEYLPGCVTQLIPQLRKDREMCRRCDPYRIAQVQACPLRKPINIAIAGEQVFLAAYQREPLSHKYTAQELEALRSGAQTSANRFDRPKV